MKYIKYLFFLLFFSIEIVFAEQNIELNNKIISFDKIDNYNLQSFTTIDDRLIIILVNSSNDAGIIKEYSLLDNKEIRSINIDKVGHANGVTYNNDKLYILNGSGDDTIYVYDSNTLKHLEDIKVGLPIRSITYVESDDIYLVRTYITGYKLDSNFKLISKIPFISNLNANRDIARQDWTYYNGYLYYSNWSWKRLGGDGANMVYVYDTKGKLVDIMYTRNDIGELEDIAFYNNKMILGFNGYDNKINFYLEDVKEINNIEENEDDDEEIVNNDKKQDKINPIIVLGGIILLLISSLLVIKKIKR